MSDIEQTIRSYIAENIVRSRDDVELGSDEPLLAGGLIDSMDLQRLIAYLEEDFEVEVSNELLVPENFETISSIARMIQGLQTEG